MLCRLLRYDLQDRAIALRRLIALAFASTFALAACANGATPAANDAAQSDLPARPAAHAGYALLYRFAGGLDGATPRAPLIEINGSLYGTTSAGGGCPQYPGGGCGTVFALDRSGAAYKERVLHRFQSTLRTHDGRSPIAGLTSIAGALYGTTGAGGGNRNDQGGLAFSITPSGTGFSVAYVFGNARNQGAGPGQLQAGPGGRLYGTMLGGALTNPYNCSSGCGAVFALVPNGKRYARTTVYRFPGDANGGNPTTTLVEDATGSLYGTTSTGGNTGSAGAYGTVYRLTPSGNTFTESVLFTFEGTNGGIPYGGLTQGPNGSFYGTTSIGGTAPCECGAVFQLTGSTLTLLYSFRGGNDGSHPRASVIMGPNGVLYGTTTAGGTTGCSQEGCGTIFALAPAAAGYTETILHRFAGGNDGADPSAPLIYAGGALYGTTSSGGIGSAGGAGGNGTVFSITL